MNKNKDLGRQTNQQKQTKTARNRRRRQRRRARDSVIVNRQGGIRNTTAATQRLSDCASLYAVTVANPFIPTGACVPTFPSIPSEKVFSFVRGSANCGTLGVGFVLVSPGYMSNSSFDGVFYTTSLYEGDIFVNAPTTGVGGAISNTPYSTTEFTSGGVQVRPVGLGIRVRYTGTELDRSGTVYLIEEPDHATLVGKNIADLMRYDQTRREPVTRSWHEVVWMPVSPAEVEYTTGSNLIPPCLGIMFTGVAGASFDYEVCYNFEAIGSIARGKTPNTADDPGKSAVLGYFGNMVSRLAPPKQWLSGLGSVLSTASKAITGNVLPMALKAISSSSSVPLLGM